MAIRIDGKALAAKVKEQVRAEAEKLLAQPNMDAVKAMDRAFIEKNLSPGGCADLLSGALFLHFLSVDKQDGL